MSKDNITIQSLITDALVKSSPIGIEDEAPSFPPVIEDGNTVAWYIADDLSTITKDGSDFMSSWRDFLGSGHDLLQALGTNQPKWFLDDGVLCDGIDNFMQALAFTYDQPEQIYIVFKQITWTSGDRIFDGNIQNWGRFSQELVTPTLQVYASAFSGQNTDLPLNEFGIARILFNGANSSFQINEGTQFTGNFGASNMGGFTVGARGGGGLNFSHIQVKEIILRKIVDTAQDNQDIYDYLISNNGL